MIGSRDCKIADAGTRVLESQWHFVYIFWKLQEIKTR